MSGRGVTLPDRVGVDHNTAQQPSYIVGVTTEETTTMDTGRLESFSDGVFAVAITLLVLNLHVRGPGHGSLLRQFGHQWPSYAALCVSFFVIGVIWVHHHNLFKRVAMVDRPLMALNLLLLLCVMVFPFPTATLATYIRHGGSDAHVAAAAYGLVVEGVVLCFLAITSWLVSQGLLDAGASVAGAHRAAQQYGGGAIAIAIAVGLSFISAVVALAAHMTIALYFLAGRGPFSTVGRTHSPASGS